MDFFERQGEARRRTAVLVAAFALAVVVVVFAVDAVAWGVLRLLDRAPANPLAWLATPQAWILSGMVTAGILGTSFFRTLQLAHGGGGRVAQLMGGRMLDPDTSRGREAMLINVVEEMAIASGVAVPDVYVLEREESLNAFAAGTQPANAVIAVTRGLLDTLDRDALQGVIAHEFSHILNGDMRLNIRLLALLAGMTAIGEIGAAPWRSLAAHRGMGHRRGSRAHPVLLAAGLALMIIGWIGVFAGRLIKAAVSRQRECLADAAAVQFTRNPDGLARALLAIHERGGGSFLAATRAEEISHMGFGRVVGGLAGLTATHPGIEERLAALGPKYVLWYRQSERARRRREREGMSAGEAATGAGTDGPGVAGPAPGPGIGIGIDAVNAALSAAALAALAGRIDATAVDHARALLRRLPAGVREAVHSPRGAADTVHALMLHAPDQREHDLALLPQARREAVRALRAQLEAECPGSDAGALDPAIRLPLIELALRGLRRLDAGERAALLDGVDALIRANGRLSVFEYAARTLLHHALARGDQRAHGTGRLDRHRDDAAIVLALLARAGHGDDEARTAAWTNAMQPLFAGQAGDVPPLGDCTLAAFTAALERLAAVEPFGKRSLLTACGDCVVADGLIRPREAELVRAIAAVLDTPVPPIAALGTASTDALSCSPHLKRSPEAE